MHLKEVQNKYLGWVLALVVGLLLLCFFIYQESYVNIYEDVDNICYWQNGNIATTTLAIENIKTIRVHRYKEASFLKKTRAANECISTNRTID